MVMAIDATSSAVRPARGLARGALGHLVEFSVVGEEG